jgi:hypothetical protein
MIAKGPNPRADLLQNNLKISSIAHHKQSLLRLAPVVALGLLSSLGTGCANLEDARLSLASVTAMSPAPEAVENGAAVRKANAFVADLPGAQIALGLGDSMLPLYKDCTMIVLERRPLDSLKPGMTIVYQGAEGWPVAHALVERTQDGWVVQGLNNPEPDAQLVTNQNYVGLVVHAYALASNPMFALVRSLATQDSAVAVASANPVPSGRTRAASL